MAAQGTRRYEATIIQFPQENRMTMLLKFVVPAVAMLCIAANGMPGQVEFNAMYRTVLARWTRVAKDAALQEA